MYDSVGDWTSQKFHFHQKTVVQVRSDLSFLCTLNSDNVNNSGRALTFGAATNPNTIESCTTACFNAGFGLAGAEFSTYVVYAV